MPTYVARSRRETDKGKDCLHSYPARSNLRRRGLFIQELKQAQEFKIGAKFNLKEIKTNLAKVSWIKLFFRVNCGLS